MLCLNPSTRAGDQEYGPLLAGPAESRLTDTPAWQLQMIRYLFTFLHVRRFPLRDPMTLRLRRQCIESYESRDDDKV